MGRTHIYKFKNRLLSSRLVARIVQQLRHTILRLGPLHTARILGQHPKLLQSLLALRQLQMRTCLQVTRLTHHLRRHPSITHHLSGRIYRSCRIIHPRQSPHLTNHRLLTVLLQIGLRLQTLKITQGIHKIALIKMNLTRILQRILRKHTLTATRHKLKRSQSRIHIPLPIRTIGPVKMRIQHKTTLRISPQIIIQLHQSTLTIATHVQTLGRHKSQTVPLPLIHAGKTTNLVGIANKPIRIVLIHIHITQAQQSILRLLRTRKLIHHPLVIHHRIVVILRIVIHQTQLQHRLTRKTAARKTIPHRFVTADGIVQQIQMHIRTTHLVIRIVHIGRSRILIDQHIQLTDFTPMILTDAHRQSLLKNRIIRRAFGARRPPVVPTLRIRKVTHQKVSIPQTVVSIPQHRRRRIAAVVHKTLEPTARLRITRLLKIHITQIVVRLRKLRHIARTRRLQKLHITIARLRKIIQAVQSLRPPIQGTHLNVAIVGAVLQTVIKQINTLRKLQIRKQLQSPKISHPLHSPVHLRIFMRNALHRLQSLAVILRSQQSLTHITVRLIHMLTVGELLHKLQKQSHNLIKRRKRKLIIQLNKMEHRILLNRHIKSIAVGRLKGYPRILLIARL